MTMTKSWKHIIGLGILAAGIAASAFGQETLTPGFQRGKAPVTLENPKFSDESAERTKQNFERLLESQPPSLRRVLQLDPSLLTNPAYMTPYPQLSEFLQQHPEVAHNPMYFLGNPEYPEIYYRGRNRNSGVGDAVEAISIFSIFLVIGGTLLWIARTIVDHRRWLRLSRLQTEANSKLMERFSSTEELLNFIQTPAGSRFLESSVVPVEPRAVGAPVNRILWSSQLGLLLVTIGAGMEFASARVVDAEAASVFDTLGILVIAAGVGFVASGLLSYVLSQRLGLLESLKLTPTSGGSAQKPS
jgi:hypothetical protein